MLQVLIVLPLAQLSPASGVKVLPQGLNSVGKTVNLLQLKKFYIFFNANYYS